jgi:hypothetical protein
VILRTGLFVPGELAEAVAEAPTAHLQRSRDVDVQVIAPQREAEALASQVVHPVMSTRPRAVRPPTRRRC